MRFYDYCLQLGGGIFFCLWPKKRHRRHRKKGNSLKAPLVAGTIFLFCLVFTVCDNPANSGSSPRRLTGTVAVNGYPIVGETLTADTGGLNGTGATSYQWTRRNPATGVIANIGTGRTYIVQPGDMGYAITVIVIRHGYSYAISSGLTAPVTYPIYIGGYAIVGHTLTAVTTDLAGEGELSFQWKRGTTVVGAGKTYMVQALDVGQTIAVTVTNRSHHSSVSGPTDAVLDNPSLPLLTGEITISGTPHVGQTLEIDTTLLGGSGEISFQWRRGAVDVGRGDDEEYTVQISDIGQSITVTVSRAGYSGTVASEPTGIVINDARIFTISREHFLDRTIELPVIRLLGDQAENLINVTVLHPVQYEGNVRWFFRGNEITGGAVSGIRRETFTIGPDVHDRQVGTFFLTVEVRLDDRPLSRVITFTVEG